MKEGEPMDFCNKPIKSRAKKYKDTVVRCCHHIKGHDGICEEYPFLSHLKSDDYSVKVAEKIVRDSENTTGAAWKSKKAGPNRAPRWVLLLPDDELETYGLNMANYEPDVAAKLKEKAASYELCIEVAIKLTWLAYQMKNSPVPTKSIKNYLESIHGTMIATSTVCEICKLQMDFLEFSKAKRGKAKIETCHKDPRLHNSENVGFAHRECNIAQGAKTLDEFYEWIEGILSRK